MYSVYALINTCKCMCGYYYYTYMNTSQFWVIHIAKLSPDQSRSPPASCGGNSDFQGCRGLQVSMKYLEYFGIPDHHRVCCRGCCFSSNHRLFFADDVFPCNIILFAWGCFFADSVCPFKSSSLFLLIFCIQTIIVFFAEDVFSFQTITIFGGGKWCCVFSKGRLPLR